MFEASKKEITDNPDEMNLVRKIQAFEHDKLTARLCLSSNAMWLRSLAQMAEKQGKADWAEKYTAASEQIAHAHGVIETLDRDGRIARNRNMDLENIVLQQKVIIGQMQKQIENLMKGL